MRYRDAAFVQPGLQLRKVRVHPADVVLDGLVGLLYAPHLQARLLGQGAEEEFHLSTERRQDPVGMNVLT